MAKSFLFRGASISYSSKGTGKTIVFLHGFLGKKELWNTFQKRLAGRYRVIIIDLPGHGKSDCLGYSHDMELLAECIQALLQLLKIRKCFIVGHSLGGYVALAFAELYPEKVAGLVLVNSTAKGDSDQRKKSREQLIQLIKEDKNRAIQLLVPSFFGTKNRTTHYQIKKYINSARHCTSQAMIATIEGMKIRKEREIVLKFCPFPFLYLIGENDPILPLEQLKMESELGENGSSYILKNTSHMSFMEAEEKVFKEVKHFVKKN